MASTLGQFIEWYDGLNGTSWEDMMDASSKRAAATAPSYRQPTLNGYYYSATSTSPTVVTHNLQIELEDPVEDKPNTSPILPAIRMLSANADTLDNVLMILQPEANMSANEALKLMMLMMSYEMCGNEFSAYEYVRANNLERHFKFE